MTETTLPNLGLSGNFAAGVDGWDVDLNHDLRVIDTLVMGTVLSAPANAPPGSPSQGDTYIVGTAPTGAWASNASAVAVWTTNEAGTALWEFYPPKSGWALELMPTTEGAPVVTYQFIGGVWITPTYAAGISVTQGSATLNGVNNIILGTNLSATAGAAGTITLNGTGGGGGGATTLAALTDVNVTEGEGIDGYGLAFEESTAKWIAKAPTFSPLCIGVSFPDLVPALAAGETIDVNIPFPYSIPENLTGSFNRVRAGATDPAKFVYGVLSGGTATALGTATITGTSVALVGSAHTGSAGDTFQITPPTTQDATLAGVSFTFVITRTA